MSGLLTTLKRPIGIRPEDVCSEPRTLRIRQKCLTWSTGNFTVTNGSQSSTPMFSVDGKASWSQKRAVRDSAGLPIFDIRRDTTGYTWYVEPPGDDSTPMITLAPRRNNGKDRMDVYVKNTVADGAEVQLQVRGLDIWKRHTNVYIGDDLVMEAKFVNLISAYIPYIKDNEWEINVSQGLDASVALAIMVVLAANLYDTSLLMTGSKAKPDAKPDVTI